MKLLRIKLDALEQEILTKVLILGVRMNPEKLFK